jgi:S-adenosylmethionine decarboxylase
MARTLRPPPETAVFHFGRWRLDAAGYGQGDVIPRQQPVLYSVDLKQCRRVTALSGEEITAVFAEALTAAGATVVEAVSHNFPGAGLTSVLFLAESHAVLHTWPETGTVNIDIFSCSPRLKSLSAIAAIAEALDAGSMSIQEVQRADGHGPLADQKH